MEKLKPCPFCGGIGKRYMLKGKHPAQYRIVCTECGARGAVGAIKEVRDAWNRRADTVKHGHYIINDDGDSRCSMCGETYLDCTQNYCPNCGARMDEPEEREC